MELCNLEVFPKFLHHVLIITQTLIFTHLAAVDLRSLPNELSLRPKHASVVT